MKIAICSVQEFNPTIGGIERVSVALAEGLVKAGTEVVFVSCRKSPYSKPYELPAKQHFLPSPLDYCQENVDAFAKIIKEENVDIVLNQNSHSELYNRMCMEVKRLTGVILVSVFHFTPDMRIKGNRHRVNFRYLPLKENITGVLRDVATRFPFRYVTMHSQHRLFRNLYFNSDSVVLLSNEYKPLYAKIAGLKETDKLVAINNMLSFPYEKCIYNKKKQILFCGRLLFHQKRPDRVLQAWSLVQDRMSDWNLVIVGDGPFRTQMQQLSVRLSLQRVEFVGFKDPVEYYKESAILCMTSNYEGWPMVLAEAMQYGCVPVAFDSFKSIHEIIQDGVNGFLIEPFDIKAYAEKVASIANDEMLHLYSENAISSVEKFSYENIVKQWIMLFESLIEQRKRS